MIWLEETGSSGKTKQDSLSIGAGQLLNAVCVELNRIVQREGANPQRKGAESRIGDLLGVLGQVLRQQPCQGSTDTVATRPGLLTPVETDELLALTHHWAVSLIEDAVEDSESSSSSGEDSDDAHIDQEVSEYLHESLRDVWTGQWVDRPIADLAKDLIGEQQGRQRYPRRATAAVVVESDYGDPERLWRLTRSDPYGKALVGPSSRGGLGAFAAVAVKRGQRIALYTHDYISRKQANDGRDCTYIWRGVLRRPRRGNLVLYGDSVRGDAAGG